MAAFRSKEACTLAIMYIGKRSKTVSSIAFDVSKKYHQARWKNDNRQFAFTLIHWDWLPKLAN